LKKDLKLGILKILILKNGYSLPKQPKYLQGEVLIFRIMKNLRFSPFFIGCLEITPNLNFKP